MDDNYFTDLVKEFLGCQYVQVSEFSEALNAKYRAYLGWDVEFPVMQAHSSVELRNFVEAFIKDVSSKISAGEVQELRNEKQQLIKKIDDLSKELKDVKQMLTKYKNYIDVTKEINGTQDIIEVGNAE